MKTRTKIVTFTLAMLLVGSVVYAADKRRQAKLEAGESDLISEEDTLSAELLAATEDHQEMSKTPTGSPSKIVDNTSDVAKDIETAVEK